MIRKNLINEAQIFWNENIYLSPDLTLFYPTELFLLSLLNISEQLYDEEFLNSNIFL